MANPRSAPRPGKAKSPEREPIRVDVEVFDHSTEGTGKLETSESNTGKVYFSTSKWQKSFTSISEAKQWIKAQGFRFAGWDKYYV